MEASATVPESASATMLRALEARRRRLSAPVGQEPEQDPDGPLTEESAYTGDVRSMLAYDLSSIGRIKLPPKRL